MCGDVIAATTDKNHYIKGTNSEEIVTYSYHSITCCFRRERKPPQHSTMNFSVALVLVIVGTVAGQACVETNECDCGSVCNNGICEQGCLVYGEFMAPGSAQRVYGRLCECGTTPDDKGLPIKCMADESFSGMPNDVERYTASARCTGGPVVEAAVVTDSVTGAPAADTNTTAPVSEITATVV